MGSALHAAEPGGVDQRRAPLLNIAPALFNAALVAYLNRIGVAGGPTEFKKKFTIENLKKYVKARSRIDRVQKGIAAAGKPE